MCLSTRWAIARPAGGSFSLVMSEHIFLPSIGHVSQPKTSNGACALGGANRVDETIARAVAIITG